MRDSDDAFLIKEGSFLDQYKHRHIINLVEKNVRRRAQQKFTLFSMKPMLDLCAGH